MHNIIKNEHESFYDKAGMIIKETLFRVWGSAGSTLQRTIMITEDIHRKLSLILLPSSSSPATPDRHDSWTLTFDVQTAPMALLTLTQKYHRAICSQSVWTNYKILLYESTRARGRQNIHVTEHHWGDSSTWLWRARQPQLYIQHFSFSPIKEVPGQSVKQLLQPWRC